jgi:hypothetical protein
MRRHGSFGQAVRVMDVVWVALVVAACVGLYKLAWRVEPHYSSRDGRRFLATGQFIDAHGEPEGRYREFRAAVLHDDIVEVSRRRNLSRATSTYRLLAKAPNLSHRRVVYVLQATDPGALGDQLALRLPPSSRTTAVLDSILQHRAGGSLSAS